jgi:hypothetical protein
MCGGGSAGAADASSRYCVPRPDRRAPLVALTSPPAANHTSQFVIGTLLVSQPMIMGVCDEADKKDCPQKSFTNGDLAAANAYVACGMNLVIVLIAIGVIVATKVLAREPYSGLGLRRGSLAHSLMEGSEGLMDGSDSEEDQGSLFNSVTEETL